MVSGIIVAAGRGSRMGAEQNKVYLPLCGRPVLQYTVQAFLDCSCIDELVIVTRACDIAQCRSLFERMQIQIVAGGKTRQESVYRGLQHITGDIAVIHDGARALVTPGLIAQAVAACEMYGAAAAGVQCKDTLKTVDANGFIIGTPDRNVTYQIQTPQVFDSEKIKAAHARALREHIEATDDCGLYERYFGRIKMVPGSYENIKLTTPEDLLLAERILEGRGGACYADRAGI